MVLAYSGGLDTSIILKWLQETYACEVVTFTADLGQGEELEPAREELEDALGLEECFRDEGVAKYDLVNVLLPVGDDFLERVCPTAPTAPAKLPRSPRRARPSFRT